MGKSRCKSRKHKGGNPQPVPVDCAKVPCPQTTADNSLTAITATGIKNQRATAAKMTNAQALAKGGGKKKKGGAARIICPQPAAGSGGSISAGGSSAHKNTTTGFKHTLTSQAQSKFDDSAKNLSTEPPKSPFPPLSGGKSRRGKSRRGKSRRGKTRRRRKSRGKSKRKTRKGRKKQRRTRKKTRGKRRY